MSTPIGQARIDVDANTDPATRALRDFSRAAQGRIRDIRGRFVSASRLITGSLTTVTSTTDHVADAVDNLRSSALLLSPALIPIAVQAAPIAASLGAAAVAVGAFGVALAGQVKRITEASEAEDKFQEAVSQHGRTSQEAVKAQAEFVRRIQEMPPATRTAAAAFSALKDTYQEWSDALAADTAPVVTKSLQALSSVFPKLTPLVRGASGEMNRFVTLVSGGIASPGFDRLIQQFSEFATGVLRRANDMLVRFVRTLDTGQIGSGVRQFMDFARANGPLVRDTFAKVVEALRNVLAAATNVGPGLLTVVNALASLVAAVPARVITVLLQLALALKAVRIAVAAMAAARVGIAAFSASIVGMRAAAAGATGVLPALGAAIATLSRTTKIAIAGTGIGLLIIALSELSQISDEAPPDVDKMTKSLERLGRSGQATGELVKQFGKNFQDLRSQIDDVVDPSVVESINNWGADITGGFLDPGAATEKLTESLGSIDKALANLVTSGKSQQAAAAVAAITKQMNPEQVRKFKGGLDEYRASLKDLEFEQKVAAQAMGLFGAQAQATAEKLRQQKASADGLRQAIQDLNDVNRAALEGMVGFEASIDAATKAAARNAGSLKIVDGQLSLNSAKARTAATALTNLASKTDEAAGAARENGQSWSTVNGIYDRGRKKLIAAAQQMGLTEVQAKKLATQILKTPDKTARLKGNMEDLQRKVNRAKKEIKSVPESKRSDLKGTVSDLEQKVRRAKAQIQSVPKSKQSELRAIISQLERQVRSAKNQIDSVRDRTVTVRANFVATPIPRNPAFANLFRSEGGPVGYAQGGNVQGFPHGGRVFGRGTPTSDSIAAFLSRGEFVIRAAAVRRYGLGLFEALNSMRIPVRSAGAIPDVRTSKERAPVVRTAPVTINLEVTNRGVLGSRLEVENWFARALDQAFRSGRLPSALRV